MEKRLCKYVFRGTTLGYAGNVTSQKIPVTCTGANPAKATLFALELSQRFTQPAVVYIAQTLNLEAIELMSANVLDKYEEEIAWAIKPAEFYKLCDGYVTVQNMQEILSNLAIETHLYVGKDNLTEWLKKAGVMSPLAINKFVKSIYLNLQNA